jgi:cytochrome c oxidase subunit 1
VPVLGTAVSLISMDKYLGTNFFDPAKGGDVLTYQNLFWFYSHPAVYVIFLPFIGVVFEIISSHAKSAVFNYKMVVYGGIGGIVLLAGEVWVHHLYVSGMADWLRIGQMVTTLMISIPVGLMMIGLVGTLYKGSIAFTTPMLYALGVVFLFLIGGLTGIPLAVPSLTLACPIPTTWSATSTTSWRWPAPSPSSPASITGSPRFSGACTTSSGASSVSGSPSSAVNIVFWTMMDIGVKGMPRRYYDYAHFPQFEGAHQLMTAGAGDSRPSASRSPC